MADFTTFKQRVLAEGRIDFDHQQGYQCVDLDRQWWYENGITNTGGNPTAISYWTNPPASLVAACDRIESSDAQAGDAVILRTNGTSPGDFSGDGHIGVATGAVSNTQIEILEQHGQGGTADGLGGNAIRTRYVDRSRVAGLYRIKQASPAPLTPPSADVPAGKYVVLPASVSSWTAYRVGSALRKGTSDVVGTLDPAEYGGLKYQIVQWVADKAVIINTQSFGQVVIWVKDTDAQFVDEDIPQAAPTPAAPVAPDWKSIYKFERLPQEMSVATNKDTNLWNLQFQGGYANAQAVAPLAADTAFTAVGKATKQDFDEHPVYYMSNESFGNADTTGEPAYWQGVNTVDLKPAAPAPAPEVVPAAIPEVSPAGTTPVDGESIPVKVIPATPKDWHDSFDTSVAGDYMAKAPVVPHDLEGVAGDGSPLEATKIVHVAGKFTGPDGLEYYRTVKSTYGFTDAAGVTHAPNWRGIPLISLEEDGDIPGYQDVLIDDFQDLLNRLPFKKKAVKVAATITEDADMWYHRLKPKKGVK